MTSEKHIKKITLYVTLAIIMLTFIMPIYWVFVSSLKIPKEYFSSPPVYLPSEITFSNYIKLFQESKTPHHLLNSLIVALVTTAASVGIGSLGAYSLARFKIGGEYLAFAILGIYMFPPVTFILPFFIFAQKLHLYDTRLILAIVYTGFFLSFVVWIMRGFFYEIPKELDEAAMIDGCSRIGAFLKVILPLAKPGLVATSLICFMFSWNEFLFALILTSTNAKTLPVELGGFITDKALLWGQMSAGGSLAIIPILALILLLQKYLVRGLTFGAIK